MGAVGSTEVAPRAVPAVTPADKRAVLDQEGTWAVHLVAVVEEEGVAAAVVGGVERAALSWFLVAVGR